MIEIMIHEQIILFEIVMSFRRSVPMTE